MEKRLFGGSVVIEKGSYVLAIKDEAKDEIAALINPEEWWNFGNDVLGFPGGGRGINSFGLDETYRQNVTREVKEELDYRISLPTFTRAHQIQMQLTPLVVAQLSGNRLIKQIGMVSSLYRYQDFNKLSRTLIEERVEAGTAFWVKLNDLVETVFEKSSQSETFFGRRGRAPFFAAAFVWYLQKSVENEAMVSYIIKQANKQTITHLKKFSTSDERVIHNGCFTAEGSVAKLTKRDREFILGKCL